MTPRVGAPTPAPPDPFLGKLIEVAIVTGNAKRTMDGLARAGIGPWQTYTFSPENTTDQTYYGQPSPFTMRVCFAEQAGMTWELIQPVSGRTIFADFLDRHGEGLHHAAFDCDGLPFEERIAGFERRGFRFSQGGSWMGCRFAFFDAEDATTTCLETILFPNDWTFPEQDLSFR